MIDIIKKRYVFDLKQVRNYYSSLLEDVKSGGMKSEVKEITSEISSAIIYSIVDKMDVDHEELKTVCEEIDHVAIRTKVQDKLISFYADKMNEIDKLINAI